MTIRVLLLAAVTLLAANVSAQTPQQRPVVFIVVDSLRPDHLQPYGYTRNTSPNLLGFARRATLFENAYAAASWTRPSILSMLTGRYSSELTTNWGGGAPLKDGHRTLATVLRSYGYRTGAFYNTAQMAPPAANVQGGFDVYTDYGAQSGPDVTDAFVARGVDHVIEFLRAAKKPAFAFLHLLDPHHPYVPRRNLFGSVPIDKYRDSYSFSTGAPSYDPAKVMPCFLVKNPATVPEMAQLYDSEIRELDAQLGRLFQFLDGDARYKNALVVVTADHGQEFGEHGGLFHGARFYEETVRVPLIVRDPTRPHSIGRRVPAVVSLVDLMPTILDLNSIRVGEGEYSGQSLLPYFTRRGGLPRDLAFIERPGCGYDPIVAVRKGDWKMIVRLTRPHVELYNLRTDPREKNDLTASRTEEVRRAYADLYATFEAWHRRVNRPLPTRNGDATPPLPAELRERLRALGYLQ